MSMSISCAGCGLEYAGGRGLSGLLPRRSDGGPTRATCACSREVVRFHRHAHALLAERRRRP